MNNTKEKLHICQLCQKYTNHKTSKCPNLICANCGHHGHAKKHCPEIEVIDLESPESPAYVPYPPSTHYNPESSPESVPNSISDRNESFRDAKLFRLFVTNLKDSVTSEDLYKRFRPKIVTVPYQGTAELTFCSKDQVSNAISTWHNTSINGRKVKCYLANSMMRLKVTNLKTSVNKEDLYKLFSQVGQIESLLMAKGKARITFRFKEDAIQAVKVFHDRFYDWFHSGPMKCYLEPIQYSGITQITQEDRVELQATNLEDSVSAQDLLMLFSEIGSLKSVTGPVNGTASVKFCDFRDAETAIQVYHNRIFNGRPMKCSLLSIT